MATNKQAIARRWSEDSGWRAHLALILDAMANLFNAKLTPQVVTWWRESLGSYPIHVIDQAFRSYISQPMDYRRAPLPGDILAVCQRIVSAERDNEMVKQDRELRRDRELHPDKYFSLADVMRSIHEVMSKADMEKAAARETAAPADKQRKRKK